MNDTLDAGIAALDRQYATSPDEHLRGRLIAARRRAGLPVRHLARIVYTAGAKATLSPPRLRARRVNEESAIESSWEIAQDESRGITVEHGGTVTNAYRHSASTEGVVVVAVTPDVLVVYASRLPANKATAAGVVRACLGAWASPAFDARYTGRNREEAMAAIYADAARQAGLQPSARAADLRICRACHTEGHYWDKTTGQPVERPQPAGAPVLTAGASGFTEEEPCPRRRTVLHETTITRLQATSRTYEATLSVQGEAVTVTEHGQGGCLTWSNWRTRERVEKAAKAALGGEFEQADALVAVMVSLHESGLRGFSAADAAPIARIEFHPEGIDEEKLAEAVDELTGRLATRPAERGR